jgi:hypothetical protein
MDVDVQRQLVRQLKILNFWITTFGILILVALGTVVYMLFRVITFVQDTSNSVQQFQQDAKDSVNIQQRACEQDGGVGNYLRSQTDFCQ